MKERFFIRTRQKGVIKQYEVVGEFAFDYRGFRFFVRWDSDAWVVSDCLCGAGIAAHRDKETAIFLAAGKIHIKFEEYLTKCKLTLKKRIA
ncbi:hypothetical protein J2T17_006812 [Paenibacillus mucilaginosus]|uniref:hypothetical protein n=1 Tax=Paenibacillus mucilaginosus TaxID=61624 RepID=UPI003D21D19D